MIVPPCRHIYILYIYFIYFSSADPTTVTVSLQDSCSWFRTSCQSLNRNQNSRWHHSCQSKNRVLNPADGLKALNGFWTIQNLWGHQVLVCCQSLESEPNMGSSVQLLWATDQNKLPENWRLARLWRPFSSIDLNCAVTSLSLWNLLS